MKKNLAKKNKKFLKVAHDMQRTNGIFGFADVVVALWKSDPAAWGMIGAEAYPDANRVAAFLSARSGPIKMGLVEIVSPRRYKITPAGIECITDRPASEEFFLPPRFSAAMDSPCVEEWIAGSRPEMAFADAIALWVGKPANGSTDAKKILAERDAIKMAAREVSESELPGAEEHVKDARLLLSFLSFIDAKFAPHLKLMETKIAASKNGDQK